MNKLNVVVICHFLIVFAFLILYLIFRNRTNYVEKEFCGVSLLNYTQNLTTNVN